MTPPWFWRAGLDPWSREAAPFLRMALTPLSVLYARLVAWKIARAKPQHISARVICIGNFTVGGTGKSPVAMSIRAHFSNKGRRAATLSRGYGGQLKGPLKVDPAHHTARGVGDEPFMLALKGESWIGAQRARAGRAMSEDGVELVIMDDGFQNMQLHKDFSLIIVDSEAGFGNGHVLPKGPLREPVKEGLKRADAILLMGDGEKPDALKSFNGPVFRATIAPIDIAPPQGALVAFAGIGRPEKMFDALRALGGDVKDAVPFPDHHVYSAADLDYLVKLAGDYGARLITTEKDHVRLPRSFAAKVLTLPVEVRVHDEAAFWTLLEIALS